MRSLFPWSIHECEVAIYAAWKDGMPMTGPGDGRRKQTAIFSGKASVKIDQSFPASEPGAFDHTNSSPAADCNYALTINFLEHAIEDDFSRMLSRFHAGGFHIVTLRYLEEGSLNEWTKRQFFYVAPATDQQEANANSDTSIAFSRSLSLRAGWMQETTGHNSPPTADPEVLGEVEWICGPHRIPCLTYDPATLTWSGTGENSTGEEAPPHVAIGTLETGSPFFSLMLPRLNPENQIQWEHTIAFTLADGTDFTPHGGHNMQSNGTPEPLLMSSQSRVLDEPVAVFRYLRRVYASVGHGLVCIPSINAESPPDTHEPSFRIGDVILLPQGAYLA